MAQIQVILEIEDNEVDDTHDTGMTEDAYIELLDHLSEYQVVTIRKR